jgi:hypothetical protein
MNMKLRNAAKTGTGNEFRPSLFPAFDAAWGAKFVPVPVFAALQTLSERIHICVKNVPFGTGYVFLFSFSFQPLLPGFWRVNLRPNCFSILHECCRAGGQSGVGVESDAFDYITIKALIQHSLPTPGGQSERPTQARSKSR